MARVVQRRTSGPYLLILFVFLFLLSAVLAGVFYNGQSKREKDLQDREKRIAQLTQERDKLVNTDVARLTRAIAGTKGLNVAADVALKEADDSLTLKEASGYAGLGLAQVVRSLCLQVADLNRQIEGLKTQNQALAAGEAVNDQTIQKVTKNLTDKIAAADKAALAAQGRVDQISKERDEALKKAGEEKDRSLREKDEKIAATLNDLESKNLEVQQRQQEINRLLEVIRGLKPQIKAGELVMRKPDGKVARVFADSQMCYINLGERDHAVVGLPFSVYGAQAGIPEDGKPKGKVLVVSVGPSTSECRLVESSREDPILEGDLVANVAYSPTRTHNFVVEGDFDLYGEGKPDPLGARRVSSLIEASGGKVQEEVSVGTDFVVMGDEPARPPKPPEDAPPATWQIYNDRMKTYDHYRQVRALATSLQIPVLNTTRFLAFTGFVPKKRLTE